MGLFTSQLHVDIKGGLFNRLEEHIFTFHFSTKSLCLNILQSCLWCLFTRFLLGECTKRAFLTVEPCLIWSQIAWQDPCQPVSEKWAWGPVKSSGFDTQDKCPQLTFVNSGSLPMAVWHTHLCTGAEETNYLCYHHHHHHQVHMRCFQKANVGQSASLIVCAGTGTFQNLQALIKNPLCA